MSRWNRSSVFGVDAKQCSRCGGIKPRTTKYFYFRREGWPNHYCIPCDKFKAREWVIKNPNKTRKRWAKWAKINRAKRLKYMNDWYYQNRERMLECRREWTRNNPERHCVQTRSYKARKRGAVGFHKVEDILSLYKKQKGRCYYCFMELCGIYHVDHKIPLTRGGSNWPSNLCCACRHCNISKNDKTEQEFYDVMWDRILEGVA